MVGNLYSIIARVHSLANAQQCIAGSSPLTHLTTPGYGVASRTGNGIADYNTGQH